MLNSKGSQEGMFLSDPPFSTNLGHVETSNTPRKKQSGHFFLHLPLAKQLPLLFGFLREAKANSAFP